MHFEATECRWNVANQPQQFKHHQIVRAFRAAEAAGVRNPSVEVHMPNGTTLVIGGGKPAASNRPGGPSTPSGVGRLSKRGRK